MPLEGRASRRAATGGSRRARRRTIRSSRSSARGCRRSRTSARSASTIDAKDSAGGRTPPAGRSDHRPGFLAQDRVRDDRAERRGADPAGPKPPIFSEKSPAPSTSVTAATIRLRLSEKSTLLTTQIRAPVTAISPNTTIDTPPSTGRNRLDHRAELRREAEHDRDHRGDREHERRVDPRDGHHADVLRVGRHARAADAARHDRRGPSPMNARPRSDRGSRPSSR